MVLEIETKTTTIKNVYLQDKNNEQKLTEALEVFTDEFLEEFFERKFFFITAYCIWVTFVKFSASLYNN